MMSDANHYLRVLGAPRDGVLTMKSQLRMASVVLGALSLSACVNTRVFTETELAEVGRGCGLAPGEVIQEPDEPRFLFIYAIGPTRQQVGCVNRWARHNNMHLSWIEAVDFTQ